MKKSLVVMGLMVSATVFISGCTTWNGISQTDTPGSYYVVTNTPQLIGTRPGVLLCTSTTTGGQSLSCKKVTIGK